MDDKLKQMGFKDFTVVNPSLTDDEYLAYQSQKRRRGHHDTWGDDYTPEGTQLSERIIGRMKVAKERTMRSLNKSTGEE